MRGGSFSIGNLPALVSAFVLLASGVAGAAEGAHGSEGDTGAWLTLGFAFLNFFIFAFLLRRFAWPPVRDFLSSRHREVADAMAQAEAARREVEKIRSEYAAKEAALEEDRRRMLEEIRRSAADDRDTALREAAVAAERLRADAERQAEHDLARARRELRAEAAKLAADLAAKDVTLRITDADRTRLVREFVETVGRP
jgi:F-type H+-transporting ATPase subunit b